MSHDRDRKQLFALPDFFSLRLVRPVFPNMLPFHRRLFSIVKIEFDDRRVEVQIEIRREEIIFMILCSL